jgi:MFS family permease
VTRAIGLRTLFARPRFVRLLATRLISQTSDGIFQTSLAGAVLFNPEHHTGPEQVAAGLVILLLPYSLVGPFAGVLLDRWRRQRVLAYGAGVRSVVVLATAGLLVRQGPHGVGFALAALVALAVNRFYLAALSAALPNVVDDESLVLANALSPTAGTVLAIAGAGIGLAVRSAAGSGDHGNAVVAVVAAAGYLAAALTSLTLPADSLGPRDPLFLPLRRQLVDVGRGLIAGAGHVWQRRPAACALAVIFGQRCLFGLWTIMTLLLYRNSFHSEGILRAGLVGVGQAVTAGGIGLVAGAVVTPRITARIGKPAWIVATTGLLAITVLAFGAPFSMPLLLVSSVLLGFGTQATKVCVDTIVQQTIDDDFRGRVFSLYDTIFNVGFVVAALVAAVALPSSGKSIGALLAMAAGYVVVAAGYAAAARSVTAGQRADDRVQQAG